MGRRMMSPSGLGFWFAGRIPRSTFWACVVAMFIATLALGLLLVTGLPTIIYYLLYAVLVYFGFVVSIKRWHDRNKSAWWVLISFIPLVGPIWAFVELGCLAGTDGENRYGDDPRR